MKQKLIIKVRIKYTYAFVKRKIEKKQLINWIIMETKIWIFLNKNRFFKNTN